MVNMQRNSPAKLILLIDNGGDVLSLINAVEIPSGHICILVRAQDWAVQFLKSIRPDAILVNWEAIRTAHPTMLHEIYKLNIGCPLVFITDAGAQSAPPNPMYHLTKPLDMEKVKGVLKECLNLESAA